MRKRLLELRSAVSPRLSLLLLFVLATVLALSSSPAPVAAELTTCCGYATSVTYYSNAQHTTIVGRCFFPCNDDPTCTGTQTQYYTVKQLTCCIC